MYHVPALLRETIEGLAVREDGTYLDGTLGGAGHFGALLERLGPGGTAIGLDRDEEAIEWARQSLPQSNARVILAHRRFSEFAEVLREHQVPSLDGALLDLGVSSHQIDTPRRGFSFQAEGPLDMRMDDCDERGATQVLQEAGEADLATLLGEFGEVRNPRRMARVLAACASEGSLRTTTDLRRCLEREYGPLQPAVLAKVFQALRIAVNDELGELQSFLAEIVDSLREGGRLVVIAYHSLEDRLVKNAMRDGEGRCVCPPGLPVCACGCRAVLKRITRGALRPSAEEISQNRRARSARLRVAEKLA